MNEQVLRTIKIADIEIGDRFRDKFDEKKISDLAESITARGLLQPVRVFEIPDTMPQKYKLIAGERRIRAHIFLNLKEISAIVDDGNNASDPKLAEISENNDREPFSPLERLRIADYIQSRIPERRGKKPKSIDSKGVDKTGNSLELPKDGEETIAFLARKSGFGSSDSLIYARHAVEEGIPEVVEAMDKGTISIYRARTIALSPKNKQLTLLADAIKDPDTLKAELTRDMTSRRKAKRKAKAKTPSTHKPHPIFNLIRIAPDWDNIVASDIYELPIDDYVSPSIAVLAIEGAGRHLPLMMRCVELMGFDYVATLTHWNPHDDVNYLDFTTAPTQHVMLAVRKGEAEVGEVFRLKTVIKQQPVLTRNSPQPLLSIINAMFPDKSDRRIDMTSTEPVKGWVVWKLTYGDPDAATDDAAEPDDVPPSAAGAENVQPLSGGIAETFGVSGDNDDTFEPDPEPAPRKRALKIF